MKKLILFLAVFPLLEAAHVDLSAYPFSSVLRNDDSSGEVVYQVYWDFDTEAETSAFAVRVRTTGWVGFGLSPNGGMIGSDVVIGWVDGSGTVFFNDRYAEAQALPPVDASQDWTLVDGEEEDGYTILRFTRPWVTCDDRDRDIEANTARVVYSWNEVDPADVNSAQYHGATQRGSASLNLLGGQTEVPPDPADIQSFTIAVNNVTIPSDDTTYWCYATQLPQEVRDQQRYITRFSPRITSNSFNFVHHMLVYLCTLDAADIETEGVCFTGGLGDSVDECTSSQLIAAWAVGGVDFNFPENVAFPIGGPGTMHGVVIEMHYDNPQLSSGVLDSSGIEFFYTSTPRQHDAGILNIGHAVTFSMIIPPNAADFSIFGLCPASCTNQFFPEEGIHVFADMLHTHLVGHGLEVQHFRRTEQCNNDIEELRPIDRNLQYDFNYQQVTHFPEEVTVLPGDTILLKCLYTTTGVRTEATYGGLATTDEMCLSFLVYYPRTDLTVCLSAPSSSAIGSFITTYFTLEEQMLFQNFDGSEGQFRNILSQIEWTDQKVQGLQQSVQNGTASTFCGIPTVDINLPDVQCSYQAPDRCGAAALAINFLFLVALVAVACLIF